MAGGHEKMNCLEVLEYFLQEYISESKQTDILLNQKFNAFEFPGTDFVSAFRVNGIPILPPLMTKSRRQEMRSYQQQAVLRELERKEKLKFQVVTKHTQNAKPDDVAAFSEPRPVEDDRIKGLSGRGMAKENAEEHLVSVDYEHPNGSDFSFCYHKINLPASDTKFVVNNGGNLADTVVELSEHNVSLNKLLTSAEEPKSEGHCLENRFAKNDMTQFVSKEQITVNNVSYCDSQMFSDSGTHSTFSQAIVTSNASGKAVVTDGHCGPVDFSPPKSSLDSGLFSKELTTIASDLAFHHDWSEALAEESDATSNEEIDHSNNSVFDVQPSIVVEANSAFSEKSLPSGGDHEPNSTLDSVPSEENSLRDDLTTGTGSALETLSEEKPLGQLPLVEQKISDEFMTSKGSVGTAFSGESNEMIRTVIDCQECTVPISNTSSNLYGKEMFKYTGSNDSSCLECDEQPTEINQELSNDASESCLTAADYLIIDKLSLRSDELCPAFLKGFNLHIERDDEAGNEGEEEEDYESAEEKKREISYRVVEEDNEEKAEERENDEGKRQEEGAGDKSRNKLNSWQITHMEKVEDKLKHKESVDNLGDDLGLKKQINAEKELEQESEDNHGQNEEQLEEEELQREVILDIIKDDEDEEHILESTCESKREIKMELKRMTEQEEEFSEDMKDNREQQEQNAEEGEKSKETEEDQAGTRNEHTDGNIELFDEGLLDDKTGPFSQENRRDLLKRKPRIDLDVKNSESVSLKTLPGYVSLEKKVAHVLGKLDKYRDTQTVYKESDYSSSTPDPSVTLPKCAAYLAGISVSTAPPKDSDLMSNSSATFSTSTELAPYLVRSSAGDTIESCMTMILADHGSRQIPLASHNQENTKCREPENREEQVLPPARIRRNSYVISSSEVSHCTESVHPTNDIGHEIRRGSYTLENPMETLKLAEVKLKTNPDKYCANKSSDFVDCCPSTKMPTKKRANSCKRSKVDASEQSSLLPADDASNSEAVAMAAIRARIQSEQVGKLEHLKRFLDQLTDVGPLETPASESLQAHEDEMDYLNKDEMDYLIKGTVNKDLPTNVDQVSSGVPVALDCLRATNSKVHDPTVVSFRGSEMAGHASCDLPVDMNKDLPVDMSKDLLILLQEEFQHKKRQLKEEHQHGLAQLLAEHQRQQLVLQQAFLLQQQHLGQRNFRSKKLPTNGSSRRCSSTDIVDQQQRDDVNKHVTVNCDRSQSAVDVVSCAGNSVDGRHVCTTGLSTGTRRPTVASAFDSGDSRMIQSTAAAHVHFEQKKMVSPAASLSTLHSEDNESEFAYKSPAVLRRPKAINSSCSPKAPLYASPALRHRTSFSEVPSSGANVCSPLAEPADGNTKVSSDVWKRLERLPALVRGYLTRRLMKTERVQYVIQTIQDTALFALHLKMESPMKKGFYSMQDRQLYDRVLAQLTAAMYEIHEIFIESSIRERMNIISQSRALMKEKIFKDSPSSVDNKRRVSAATLKAIERKRKAVELEMCAKQQSVKSLSEDDSRKSPPDKSTSVGTTRRMKHQNDVRPVCPKTSPRKAGKENVHRILGKEKTRVVATNASNKPKMPGCNAKVSKKTTVVAPTRKVARIAHKQMEDHAAVKQLNFCNNHVAHATINVHDRKHLDLRQNESASNAAVKLNSRHKLPPNSNPSDRRNPQVGGTVYDSDSHSPSDSLSRSQENFSKMMSAYQRHTVKSCAVQEKESTRKIAGVKSRLG